MEFGLLQFQEKESESSSISRKPYLKCYYNDEIFYETELTGFGSEAIRGLCADSRFSIFEI